MPPRDNKFRGLIGVPRPLPDDEAPESTPLRPVAAAIEPKEFARPVQPPRSRRSRSRVSAREAVIAARNSSRHEPQAWVRYTTQLPDTLSARLVRRLVRDRDASGDLQLGLLHYLNVAFARIPQSPLEDWFPPEDPEELAAWVPPEAAQWALAWRVRGDASRKPTRAGSQLHEDVALAMHQLSERLKLIPGIWAWEVQAEALARVLDELDADQAGG